jgi:hypothetical protein
MDMTSRRGGTFLKPNVPNVWKGVGKRKEDEVIEQKTEMELRTKDTQTKRCNQAVCGWTLMTVLDEKNVARNFVNLVFGIERYRLYYISFLFD